MPDGIRVSGRAETRSLTTVENQTESHSTELHATIKLGVDAQAYCRRLGACPRGNPKCFSTVPERQGNSWDLGPCAQILPDGLNPRILSPPCSGEQRPGNHQRPPRPHQRICLAHLRHRRPPAAAAKSRSTRKPSCNATENGSSSATTKATSTNIQSPPPSEPSCLECSLREQLLGVAFVPCRLFATMRKHPVRYGRGG